MKSIGQKASKKEIKSMIKEVDINSNGTVEFDEFCEMMKIKMEHNDQEQEIREAFKYVWMRKHLGYKSPVVNSRLSY